MEESACKVSPIWVPVRANRWPHHVTVCCSGPLCCETSDDDTWHMKRTCIQLLGWVPEGNNRLEKSRCRWRTIKMDLIKKIQAHELDEFG